MTDFAQFLMDHGNRVLFLVVFAEQAGAPLPAAPWLLAVGALSATGHLNPLVAIAVTALACVLADWAWFYIGRRGGPRVLRFFCRLSLSPTPCVGRTRELFAQHGLQVLIAAKFIPVLGTVMPPLAGAYGMRTGRFLLLDSLGSLVYAAVYIVAGFVFHNQLAQAATGLTRLGHNALLLGLALTLTYVAFKYIRRHRSAAAHERRDKAGPQGLPLPEPGGRL